MENLSVPSCSVTAIPWHSVLDEVQSAVTSQRRFCQFWSDPYCKIFVLQKTEIWIKSKAQWNFFSFCGNYKIKRLFLNLVVRWDLLVDKMSKNRVRLVKRMCPDMRVRRVPFFQLEIRKKERTYQILHRRRGALFKWASSVTESHHDSQEQVFFELSFPEFFPARKECRLECYFGLVLRGKLTTFCVMLQLIFPFSRYWTPIGLDCDYFLQMNMKECE